MQRDVAWLVHKWLACLTSSYCRHLLELFLARIVIHVISLRIPDNGKREGNVSDCSCSAAAGRRLCGEQERYNHHLQPDMQDGLLRDDVSLLASCCRCIGCNCWSSHIRYGQVGLCALSAFRCLENSVFSRSHIATTRIMLAC